jgi:hypothetical protein
MMLFDDAGSDAIVVVVASIVVVAVNVDDATNVSVTIAPVTVAVDTDAIHG